MGYFPRPDPRIPAPSNDLSTQGGFTPSQIFTVGANYVVTPKLLAEVRFGRQYRNDRLACLATGCSYSMYGIPSGAQYTYQTPSSNSATPVPSQFAGPTGFQNISSNYAITKQIDIKEDLYLDGSYFTVLKKQQHSFKFGFSLMHLHNDWLDGTPGGSFQIYWGQVYNNGPSYVNVAGPYGYYVLQDYGHAASVSSRNQGFYFQDSWRVHPRLTV